MGGDGSTASKTEGRASLAARFPRLEQTFPALTPQAQLQLNVDNLFDERFYYGLDDNHVNVGAGRSVHLSLSVHG